jgi:archaellum component FlaD/FlaE
MEDSKMRRYLKQMPGGYIYSWTPLQAERRDMVEISEEQALKELPTQIRPTKPKPVEVPVEEVPVQLTATDTKSDDEGKVIMDDDKEEVPGDDKEEGDSSKVDPDIAFLENIRKVGRGKQQIEAFMRQRYNIEVDRRFKLNELVDQAVAARRKELTKAEAA